MARYFYISICRYLICCDWKKYWKGLETIPQKGKAAKFIKVQGIVKCLELLKWHRRCRPFKNCLVRDSHGWFPDLNLLNGCFPHGIAGSHRISTFFWNLLNHHLNVLFFGNSLGYSIYRGPLFSSPKKKQTPSAVSKAGLNSNWRIQLGAVQFTAQGRPDLERVQGLGVREKKMAIDIVDLPMKNGVVPWFL